ncbi:hypothetical protein BGZ47_001614 [Haplosporangium gracile]|nr:hypothetical protein BGZ47_001591 [Haplosporangium gracile]KAF8948899.1 hypothetical protein BGZ47_001614 [Haplosporangium gracile]
MATAIPTLMGLLSFAVYALFGGENHGRGYLSFQVVLTLADTNALSATTGNNIPELVDNKKDSISTLQDINLAIPKGSPTVVVGRFGQGKLSFRSTLIGEMYKRQGSVHVLGSVAFVSQQTWIQNGSIMDNILFGLPLDQKRYDAVIQAPCLQQDLGNACCRGLLKDKTCLLVTHGVHHLGAVNQIVIIKKGRIFATGTYEQLLSAGFLTSQELSLSVETDRVVEGGDDDPVVAADPGLVAGSADAIKKSDGSVDPVPSTVWPAYAGSLLFDTYKTADKKNVMRVLYEAKVAPANSKLNCTLDA